MNAPRRPLPFHVSCTLPAVDLYELDDGRFQLIQPGPVAPFMTGYRYVLVEQALADHLAGLPVEGLRMEPAVLFDRGRGEEMRSHVRLHIAGYFSHDMIRDLNLSGLRFLLMGDEYCFVTPALKQALERSGFGYLAFSEGLQGFAA